MGRIRWKLRRIDKKDLYRVKWNFEDLRSDNIQAKYEETVSNRFGVLMEKELGVDELAQEVAKVLKEAAKETLEKVPTKVKKKWISAETMLLIERKRQIKNQRSRSTEYTELKREVQKALRTDKEKWLE